MAKVQPIGPDEVGKKKAADIPDAVFEIFNELIARDFNGKKSVVRQDEVIVALEEKGFQSREIFDKHWLDIEGAYREKGWAVIYEDKVFRFEKK